MGGGELLGKFILETFSHFGAKRGTGWGDEGFGERIGGVGC